MACDVVIVVPKLDEFQTIAWAFGVDLDKADEQLEVGGFAYHRLIGGLEVCFAFMDGQDTLRAGLVTMEVLMRHEPRYAFLVGTALGNDKETPVASVVVSSEIQYLVELLQDTQSGKVTFRNPTRLTSTGRMSPQARTVAGRKFNRQKVNAVIREAGDHLNCADEAENIIATYKPTLLVEAIGSSNIYYKAPEGLESLTQDALFTHSSGFKLYDMESAGFAKAAAALGVEWLVVRGISDYGRKISENVRRIATAAAGRCLAEILPETCDSLNVFLDGFDTRIDGDWWGMFGFFASNGDFTLLEDDVVIRQSRTDRASATVRSTFVEGRFSPHETHYEVEFNLMKLGHVAGRWTDGRAVERYFGVMLGELRENDSVVRGSWIGVSQATSARIGVFEWHRVARNGSPEARVRNYDLRSALIERLEARG